MTQRLSNSTINRMITESRKIQRGIVVWLGILIVAIFVLVNPANRNTLIIYAGSATAIIISISAIVMSALRIRGLDNQKPRVTLEEVGEVSNDDDASDVLNFPQVHTPTDARLVAVADKTIYLSTHQPDNGTWGDLANTLYDHGWAWSREGALRESECFKNLTTVYPELTKDMLRMRIVKGRRNNYHVSLKGQMVFVAESPDLSLEHVHVKR